MGSAGKIKTNVRRRAFTLMETLVIIGILVILLSIFIPYLLSLRETSRRITCADNLKQIRDALTSYALSNAREFPRVKYDAANNPNGYTAFTGPDSDNPFADTSAVAPNDVTASLWLLVRGGYITNTGVFVCPSSDGLRDLVTDASGRLVKVSQRGNFRRPRNLSYSYASPFSSVPDFRMNLDFVKYEFALLADKNPGAPAASVKADASPRELVRGNSSNHGGVGQNVLYGSGSVYFVTTPYCGGVMKSPKAGDNIYTARAASPTTQAAALSWDVPGVVGHNVGPIRNDDSFLIPTAEDGVVMPSTRPATAPSTIPGPTTQPATQPTTTPATLPATTTTAPAAEPATTSTSGPTTSGPSQ